MIVLSARDRTSPTNPDVPLLEVRAINELLRQFDRLGLELTIESGKTIQSEQAKNVGLIILGDSSSNPEADQFLRKHDPIWRTYGAQGGKSIVGSTTTFTDKRDDSGSWIVVGHAIITSAKSHRNDTERAVLVAGSTAIMTQAALVALTRPDIQNELLRRFGGRDFSVVLEAHLARETVGSVRIVAAERLVPLAV